MRDGGCGMTAQENLSQEASNQPDADTRAHVHNHPHSTDMTTFNDKVCTHSRWYHRTHIRQLALLSRNASLKAQQKKAMHTHTSTLPDAASAIRLTSGTMRTMPASAVAISGDLGDRRRMTSAGPSSGIGGVGGGTTCKTQQAHTHSV